AAASPASGHGCAGTQQAWLTAGQVPSAVRMLMKSSSQLAGKVVSTGDVAQIPPSSRQVTGAGSAPAGTQQAWLTAGQLPEPILVPGKSVAHSAGNPVSMGEVAQKPPCSWQVAAGCCCD